VTIRLDPAYSRGETFTIQCENWGTANVYIKSASLNGKPLDRCFLRHEEISNGGKLVLNMGGAT
jgi:putative alpha-1,2-mannosidase